MRKISKRRISNNAAIRKLTEGDAWHHDIMAYLGAINTPMVLLALLRLVTIFKPIKGLSNGSIEDDIPLDVMALFVLGMANFSQAYMNFWSGWRTDRWIMGKGLDRITVLDALFTILDWSAAIKKLSLV
jgi:hypothetical protein